MMMLELADQAVQLTHHLLVMDPPDPGSGEAPPGSGRITKILRWAFWLASAACVLGILIAGGMMAVAANRGGNSEHMSRLGWAMLGCIVIAASSGIVAALL